MNEKELAKQLNTYADGITAFAVVQAFGFTLLVAQSLSLACAISARWYIAGPLVIVFSFAYLFLIRLCQRAEDDVDLPAERESKVSKAIKTIRVARLWIIVSLGIGETVLVIGMRFLPPVFTCPNIDLPLGTIR